MEPFLDDNFSLGFLFFLRNVHFYLQQPPFRLGSAPPHPLVGRSHCSRLISQARWENPTVGVENHNSQQAERLQRRALPLPAGKSAQSLTHLHLGRLPPIPGGSHERKRDLFGYRGRDSSYERALRYTQNESLVGGGDMAGRTLVSVPPEQAGGGDRPAGKNPERSVGDEECSLSDFFLPSGVSKP